MRQIAEGGTGNRRTLPVAAETLRQQAHVAPGETSGNHFTDVQRAHKQGKFNINGDDDFVQRRKAKAPTGFSVPSARQDSQPFSIGGVQQHGSRMRSSDAAAGKAADAGLQLVIERPRDTLAQRGAHGMIGLGRTFKSMDDDGSGNLDQQEFNKAMVELNMNLSNREQLRLFQHFDADHSGRIDFDEFLNAVRAPIN